MYRFSDSLTCVSVPGEGGLDDFHFSIVHVHFDFVN